MLPIDAARAYAAMMPRDVAMRAICADAILIMPALPMPS